MHVHYWFQRSHVWRYTPFWLVNSYLIVHNSNNLLNLKSVCSLNLILLSWLARSSCSSNPCLNGGSCNEENAGYSCTCRSGYKGNNCQGSLFICSNYFELIQTSLLLKYCFPCFYFIYFRWNSRIKQFLIFFNSSDHVCHPSPCSNGGTCYVKNGSPYCACSDGFIGDKCQCKQIILTDHY